MIEPTFIHAGAAHEELLLEFMQEFYACEHLPFNQSVAQAALQEILTNKTFGHIYLIDVDRHRLHRSYTRYIWRRGRKALTAEHAKFAEKNLFFFGFNFKAFSLRSLRLNSFLRVFDRVSGGRQRKYVRKGTLPQIRIQRP